MDYPEILKEVPRHDLERWAKVNGFDPQNFYKVEAEWERQNLQNVSLIESDE